MSTKHFFPQTEGVVVLGLESLVARNRHLGLDPTNKVIYSRQHTPSKIALISGGGSGHEPAWSGYVGEGMLAAAVNGEVFASPSTKQIMAAIKLVPSDVGVILCIVNYTGDSLHFGLAREKAEGLGMKVGVLRITDDVALGRKQTENTGRRGLTAQMFVLKVCGAASEAGYAFEDIIRLGESVNAQAVTVGSTLDHCHIPGREHHRSVPDDVVVLGMGIHNEPGLHEISPIPDVDKFVGTMLDYCLDPDDKDRAFVEFKPNDAVCLMINNLGGVSTLELEALTSVTLKVLQSKWRIEPIRIFAQCFQTSLNAPGWSISLINISGIERRTEIKVAELLRLLDSETTAPSWPRNGFKVPESSLDPDRTEIKSDKADVTPKGPHVDPRRTETAIRSACDAAIAAEPDITKWDIQMGDGDCGEAVVGMCQGILKQLDAGLCSDGSLYHILDEIEAAVEEIGGTLGAIISIIVASFATNLRGNNQGEFDVAAAGTAAKQALTNLMNYTGARQGSRTVMDALIPFCDTLESVKNLEEAVAAAEKGAQSTIGMKAKFGRATYVGDKGEDGTNDIPPDPGAMAAAIFLRGLVDGLKG